MEATDMTFGVEIECTVPVGAIEVGGYTSGIQVPGMPIGWVAKHDRSICAGRGRQGAEIVSPILSGASGLRQIIDVCRSLRELGATVNRSTGLHVHIGFDRANNAALTRLITLTANFEKALYASSGTKRRERGSYCASIHTLSDAENVRRYHDRYRILNIVSGKPTVEFRPFAGTTNSEKIIAHVLTCLGIVERAVTAKRVTNWTAKQPVESSPIRRDGEGQTALNRLFYQLGWTKGRSKRSFGMIDCEAVPSVDRLKHTLMRLAKKYDSQS